MLLTKSRDAKFLIEKIYFLFYPYQYVLSEGDGVLAAGIVQGPGEVGHVQPDHLLR